MANPKGGLLSIADYNPAERKEPEVIYTQAGPLVIESDPPKPKPAKKE